MFNSPMIEATDTTGMMLIAVRKTTGGKIRWVIRFEYQGEATQHPLIDTQFNSGEYIEYTSRELYFMAKAAGFLSWQPSGISNRRIKNDIYSL